MKKLLLLTLAFLLLPSCAKALHSLDGLPSVRKETLRPEEKTEFWKTLSPFSYTPDDSAVPADLVQNLDETPTVARSSDAGTLSLNLNGLPYRCDEQTGNLVCLHTDPLCQHGGAECPFYLAIGGFREHNGCVYFKSMGVYDPLTKTTVNPSGNWLDRQWDVGSMKVKTIRERPHGVQCDTAVYDGVFRYVYDISYREEDKQEIWTLLRQNLKTGKTEVLEETEGQPPLLAAVRDRMYFWLHSGYGTLYVSRTDAILERREICQGVREGNIYAEGDCLWFPAKNGEESGLLSCRPEDGETAFLALPGITDSAFYRMCYDMTDRNVYYLSGQERSVTVKTKDGRNQMYTLSPGRLVRLDRETGEVEDILVLDGELAGVSLYDFSVSGHYLYAPLCFVEDETFYGLGGSHILRIDLNDRSRYVIAAPDLNEE